MLSIYDQHHGFGRREFLKIGSLALGGFSLPGLLAAQATGRARKSVVTDKSVILLFMHGGPSQIETFDPKMSAPAEIRSMTGEVATSLPGITFGSTYPKLAAHGRSALSIVRSYQVGRRQSRHQAGRRQGHDAGQSRLALLPRGRHDASADGHAHQCGPVSARRSIPTPSRSPRHFGKFTDTGTLGVAYAPFVPGGGGQLQKNMTLELPRDRLDDRRGLLTRLDGIKRAIDTTGTLEGIDYFQQQAFQTILGGVADAFDLSKEDPETLARYDTAGLVRPDQIDRKLEQLQELRRPRPLAGPAAACWPAGCARRAAAS